MGTKRLLYPGMVFDLVHCACCRVPWHIEGGKLLLELNRVLQPGGYFVWSATPVYQKLAEDVEIWTAMSAIKADPLCYELWNASLRITCLNLRKVMWLYGLLFLWFSCMSASSKMFSMLTVLVHAIICSPSFMPDEQCNLDSSFVTDPSLTFPQNCLLNSVLTWYDISESSLIFSLKFAPEDKWLSSFYSCLIKKYDKESMVEAKFRKLEQETCDNNTASLPVACTLKNNTDLLACKAEYYHQSGEYQKCFELTSALLERDPFHLKSTLVHLTTAMELGHSNELYLMTCNLVKDYPQKALSWFVVGCYYYCIKKYSESRRFFSKATTLDGTFLPAWIGHGNAFAAQEEGDQAMSSFRTAARSFPGCHLPTLYIRMEYMRTHNLTCREG